MQGVDTRYTTALFLIVEFVAKRMGVARLLHVTRLIPPRGDTSLHNARKSLEV